MIFWAGNMFVVLLLSRCYGDSRVLLFSHGFPCCIVQPSTYTQRTKFSSIDSSLGEVAEITELLREVSQNCRDGAAAEDAQHRSFPVAEAKQGMDMLLLEMLTGKDPAEWGEAVQ